jgi:pimeloyl-ACP methyl ester carboxylesterase
MSFYEKGPVRIHYEETGSGFPLLLIAGGGLNSTIAGLTSGSPFDPIVEFKGEYRCIASDLRNANGGYSSGPLEIDRPWDAYTDDHLGLMHHLGIDKFMALGFCIGGPFIWNLLRRAPDRILAAVLAQPSHSAVDPGPLSTLPAHGIPADYQSRCVFELRFRPKLCFKPKPCRTVPVDGSKPSRPVPCCRPSCREGTSHAWPGTLRFPRRGSLWRTSL